MGQNRWQGKDLSTFKAELAQLSFPPIDNFELEEHHEPYKQYLEHQSTENFLIDLFGENHYPQKANLLKNIKNYLQTVPTGQSTLPNVGFKFPLVPMGTLPKPFDILFWGDMAKKLFSPQANSTYVFWNRHQAPEQSYMLLFFTKPGPQAFRSLIRPENANPSWYNFVSQSLNEGLPDQEEDGSESHMPLEDTSRSLQEWLNQCCVG